MALGCRVGFGGFQDRGVRALATKGRCFLPAARGEKWTSINPS